MIESYLKKKFSFTVSFTLAELLLAVFFLLFSIYILWEVYWWNKIGLYFIKWHTHIVFTALLSGVFVLLPLFGISSLFNESKRMKIQTLSVGAWAGCVVVEMLLMVFNINKTYSEERNGYYRSPYEPEVKNTYHVYHVNDSVAVNAPEFSLKKWTTAWQVILQMRINCLTYCLVVKV